MKRFNFIFAVFAALLVHPAIIVIYSRPRVEDCVPKDVRTVLPALPRPVPQASSAQRSFVPIVPRNPNVWEEKELNGVKYYIMPLNAHPRMRTGRVAVETKQESFREPFLDRRSNGL